MKVVPYSSKCQKEVQQICLTTASVTPGKTRKHDYILGMYCDFYLEHGISYVLLDDDDTPKGYILCSPDHGAYLHNIKPYLKRIRFPYNLFAKAEIGTYAPCAAEYPAHLHIDILEEYTGSGNGGKLMKALLAELKAQGIVGIMLNVAAGNMRAIRFYQKQGFRILKESKTMLTMGQKLIP